MTNDTCGPLFDGLSKSADLQRCLENRLRQRLDANGSPEYALTWKYWTMQSGPPICALRASGHRISDSAYGGWQTPKLPSGGACERNTPGGGTRKLEDQAEILAGWATASTRDWKDTGDLEKSRFRKDGKERNDTVPRQAGMALPSGTPAETASNAGYRLNPMFSLYLQGYPLSWGISGFLAAISLKRSGELWERTETRPEKYCERCGVRLLRKRYGKTLET